MFKKVGVIGLGAVGISAAHILQKSGVEVIALRNSDADIYCQMMKDQKIVVIDETGNEKLNFNGSLNIEITSSMTSLICQSDLILNCGLFPEGQYPIHFELREKKMLQKKKIPIIAFPGMIGSSWLVGYNQMEEGLVSTSPVFAVKQKYMTPEKSLVVRIKTLKSRISLGYPDTVVRLSLLSFLNKKFNFHGDIPTFVDGGVPLKTALGTPDMAINGAAVCENSAELVASKGQPFRVALYSLSKPYSEIFQSVFQEQIKLAERLGIEDVKSLKHWLLNRPQSVEPGTITKMLHQIYSNKFIMLSGTDRRITESYDALLFFKLLSKELSLNVEATDELLNQLKDLKAKMKYYCSYQDNYDYIATEAINYAKKRICVTTQAEV